MWKTEERRWEIRDQESSLYYICVLIRYDTSLDRWQVWYSFFVRKIPKNVWVFTRWPKKYVYFQNYKLNSANVCVYLPYCCFSFQKYPPHVLTSTHIQTLINNEQTPASSATQPCHPPPRSLATHPAPSSAASKPPNPDLSPLLRHSPALSLCLKDWATAMPGGPQSEVTSGIVASYEKWGRRVWSIKIMTCSTKWGDATPHYCNDILLTKVTTISKSLC